MEGATTLVSTLKQLRSNIYLAAAQQSNIK